MVCLLNNTKPWCWFWCQRPVQDWKITEATPLSCPGTMDTASHFRCKRCLAVSVYFFVSGYLGLFTLSIAHTSEGRTPSRSRCLPPDAISCFSVLNIMPYIQLECSIGIGLDNNTVFSFGFLYDLKNQHYYFFKYCCCRYFCG